MVQEVLSPFLEALQGRRREFPLWIMRQAGRYLPEYQKLREKRSLKELFFEEELIVEVTKMPLRRFPFDAAILFSDILVIGEALGFSLSYREGPEILPLWDEGFYLEKKRAVFSPMLRAIVRLKKELTVPLIGFVGAPFTVATYLVGGVDAALQLYRTKRGPFLELLKAIGELSVEYLEMQVKAGVDAIQVFDSWANVLDEEAFCIVSLPFLETVSKMAVPSLFFMRNGGRWVEKIPCGISLDEESSLVEARRKTKQVLQGNFSPKFLFESVDVIQKKVEEMLRPMRDDPAYIVNLGHGILPKTPLEGVEAFISAVKRFPL